MEQFGVGELQKKSVDTERRIQENIAKWQSGDVLLAPLSNAQKDIIYQIGDFIKEQFYPSLEITESHESKGECYDIPLMDTNLEYIKWMVKAENEIKYENHKEYIQYFDKLCEQSLDLKMLLRDTETTIENMKQLREMYQQVVVKTNSLHSLSEQLMKHQKELKSKKQCLKEKLLNFTAYDMLPDTINTHNLSSVNSDNFMATLDKIDTVMEYLMNHKHFKESIPYSIKYEKFLSKAILIVQRLVNSVIFDATRQVMNPDGKTNLLVLENNSSEIDTSVDSAFSLYYGKFQSAAIKVRPIISHTEEKVEKHYLYKQLISDCQQTYLTQRSPVMTAAVVKALEELKAHHKSDYSVLFRSSGLFIMQVCQDEAACFHYFFAGDSPQLTEYLAVLCQNLYDVLRPSLICINHLEVLTELCGILRKEMLNYQTLNNAVLDKFVEIIKQLLQDVEERLVFRTNVFFQHDLSGYQPSPGDLAYPEKLEQIENINMEESRTDSRSSVMSMESQEIASINANQMGQIRSYTGNSPADLHGMWYPTVKRTLVCLSRLYFCLDREIFQGLAQEALSICVRTINDAAIEIAKRKSQVDGKLFQIKHLLIVREQIAPFQVDFTVKEMTLDFSNVKTAAVELIHNRYKLFTFNSNNALLEFLLEGTPKVKQYLVDSRKEIDKELKVSCEAFITHTSHFLVGNVINWIQKVEQFLISNKDNAVSLREQEFAKPQTVAGIIVIAQRKIKTKLSELQKSMQLYLSNRETEFILFRPVKNNIINAFIQVEHLLNLGKYSSDDLLVIACPSAEQVNVLICSVSLTAEQDLHTSSSRASHTEFPPQEKNTASIQ